MDSDSPVSGILKWRCIMAEMTGRPAINDEELAGISGGEKVKDREIKCERCGKKIPKDLMSEHLKTCKG